MGSYFQWRKGFNAKAGTRELTDRGLMIPISAATIGFSIRSALNSERAEEIFRALDDKTWREGGGVSREASHHGKKKAARYSRSIAKYKSQDINNVSQSSTLSGRKKSGGPWMTNVGGGGGGSAGILHAKAKKSSTLQASRSRKPNKAALQQHPGVPWNHRRVETSIPLFCSSKHPLPT